MTMGIVVVLGCVVLGLHAYIVSRFPSGARAMNAADRALEERFLADRKQAAAKVAESEVPSAPAAATSAESSDAAPPQKVMLFLRGCSWHSCLGAFADALLPSRALL
jgi:hypothetical protein